MELERWHDFFVLVGTAGATLVALLFVAVSLGSGFLSNKRTAPTRAFFSPVVLHFSVVLFIAAVALMPGHSVRSLAALTGASALIGVGVSGFIVVQLLRNTWTEYLIDHLAYGLLPGLCYIALLVASVMILSADGTGLDVLAGALLLLLIVNIRNAWDLTLSMVRHQTDRTRKR